MCAKEIIFSDEAHFDLSVYVNKQNCRIWGTENPHATLKGRRTQNESLFGADFGLEAYSQWRSLSGHVERIFVHKNWSGRYWQHLVSTARHCASHSRSYTRCFATVFEDRNISRRADVVWQPRSCDFTVGLFYTIKYKINAHNISGVES